MITRRHFIILFSVCALLTSSAALHASDTTVESGSRVVTLHDLLVGALNKNVELRARRLEPEIQDLRVEASRGVFEPAFVAGGSYQSSERRKSAQENSSIGSIFGGNNDPILRENTGRFQTGIIGRLPYGTSYELLTNLDEIRNSYNSFNSEFVSSTTLSITQPLMKDFGKTAGLAEIRLQQQASVAARHELRANVLRVLREVASAYYEMAFAQENVTVKQQAVDVAASLVHDNQRRLDEGRMAPIDVTQAQSRLAESKEELLLARNFLAQRRNALRELTQDEFGEDDSFTVDRNFTTTVMPTVNRLSARGNLYTHNPSYLASVEIAKGEDIRIAYAKNQNQPRVDFRATFGYNGLSDAAENAYRDYRERDKPTWSAGLIVNVPFFDRTGKSRLSEAKKRKLQALLTIQRTELTLVSALDTAFRDIENAGERVILVKDAVRLAESALNAELKRLSSGLTTSYNVAQAQRDLSQARSRELATYVDLNKAVTNLSFITGTLHISLRVEIESD